MNGKTPLPLIGGADTAGIRIIGKCHEGDNNKGCTDGRRSRGMMVPSKITQEALLSSIYQPG
jgi:hypothetical protein